ncbi:MAG: rhamnogalacturonan acetylesterase [Chitinophagaceae bacterium]
MKKYTCFFWLIAIATMVMAFVQGSPITLYMIGDSTMSVKSRKAYPETGWGMAFPAFFKNGVTVKDLALNGRSSKSFRKDVNEAKATTVDHWQPILDALKPGDYVMIEFGHNDEKKDKPLVGTTVDEFKANLAQYVQETRDHKAFPILLTPIVRRAFKGGVLQDTHVPYADAVRRVADSLNVPLIDMQKSTAKLVGGLGDQASIELYNYVDSGNVNYPKGKKDDTHLSPKGADEFAYLAAEGLKLLHLPLSDYVELKKR